MMPYHSPYDPDLDALIERGKVIPSVSDVVRARALSRARLTVAAAANLREPTSSTRRRGLLLALAASAALVVVAAGAVAALQGRAPRSLPPLSPVPAVSPRPVQPVQVATPDSPSATPTIAPQIALTATPRLSGRPATAQETYAAELRLLQRAQVAYTDGDYARSLSMLAEHGRRFPNGRLTEEREALRVRALAGSGRTDEASRAAEAFGNRFPRSVFLPPLDR
jgi:hypothetical protein